MSRAMKMKKVLIKALLALACAALGLAPILHLRMRLGEGTGAAVALPVLRAAVATLTSMSTFTQAGVSGPAGGTDG